MCVCVQNGRDPNASRRGFSSFRPRKVSNHGLPGEVGVGAGVALSVPRDSRSQPHAPCPSSRVRDRPKRISPGGGGGVAVVNVVCWRVGGGGPCHLVPAATAAADPTLLDVYHCRRVPTNGRRRNERSGGRWRVAVKRAHCDREPRTLVRSRPGNVVRRTPKLGRIARRQCRYRVILVGTCELSPSPLPTAVLDIISSMIMTIIIYYYRRLQTRDNCDFS